MTDETLPTEDALRQALKKVVDPELSVNIVDLGLIYRIEITPGQVSIDMTMTSPACPVAEIIMEDAQDALAPLLPAGCPVAIKLVWNPPWDPAMMSERTKQNLGW